MVRVMCCVVRVMVYCVVRVRDEGEVLCCEGEG